MDANLNLQKQRNAQAELNTMQQKSEEMQSMKLDFMYGGPGAEMLEKERDLVANRAKLATDVSTIGARITEQYGTEKVVGSARKEAAPPADDELASTGILLQLSNYMRARVIKEAGR